MMSPGDSVCTADTLQAASAWARAVDGHGMSAVASGPGHPDQRRRAGPGRVTESSSNRSTSSVSALLVLEQSDPCLLGLFKGPCEIEFAVPDTRHFIGLSP